MKSIPNNVVEGLKVIRNTGKYNMMDSQSVVRELYELEYFEAVSWLMGNETKGYGTQVDVDKYMLALNML